MIEVPADEARALAEQGLEALMLPKEALVASQRVLAENLLRFIDGPMERRAVALGLVVWGSDCTACGNATADSLVCDSCGSEEHTVILWRADIPEDEEPEAVTDRAEFIDACRAQAFHVKEGTDAGRVLIHSTTAPPMVIGADTDLESVIATIEAARDVAWMAHPLLDDHGLAVLTEEGRLRYYQVVKPDREV